MSFVLVVVTGVVLVLVFLRREANLSELQADFVSKVSHELRTPLTSIRLFAETMERARGDAATQDKCLGGAEPRDRAPDAAHRAPARLGADGGRAQAVRARSEEQVADIVDEALDAFAPLRDRHPDLDFAVEVRAGSAARARRRAHAMVDAIVNLLSNAQKYGGTPPVVRLRASRAGTTASPSR